MSKAKKKWVSVRPLPSIRNFPQQYDVSPMNGSARCPFPPSTVQCFEACSIVDLSEKQARDVG